jgi:hypothetical protein
MTKEIDLQLEVRTESLQASAKRRRSQRTCDDVAKIGRQEHMKPATDAMFTIVTAERPALSIFAPRSDRKRIRRKSIADTATLHQW